MRRSTSSGVAEPDVERVLHRARRMAGREVERLEVVPVELDLGAFGDLVAEADEHVFELAPDPRDRMQVPAHVLVPAEREVEPVADGRIARRRRLAASRAAPRARLRATPARADTACPTRRSFRTVDALDRLADLVERRRLAEVPALDVGQIVERGRGRDGVGAFARDCVGARRRARRAVTHLLRWRAASNNSTLPAIATFSDSPAAIGIVTDPSSGSDASRPRVSWPSTNAVGTRRSTASGAAPPCATCTDPVHAGAPEQLEHLHCGHALHDPRPRNTRRPRRARPSDCTHRPSPPPGRSTSAPAAAALRSNVPALPGSLQRDCDDPRSTPSSAADARGAAAERARRRVAASRCRRRARRRAPLPARPPRRRAPRSRPRRFRRSTSMSSTPWSSAVSTSRGPSHTNTPSASRALPVAQQHAQTTDVRLRRRRQIRRRQRRGHRVRSRRAR